MESGVPRKRSRFTETQIVSILKEVEAGRGVKELCRTHGISEATFYNWKAKDGGLSASELHRLRETEVELRKLKWMYADLALENRALKDLLEKNFRDAGETGSGRVHGRDPRGVDSAKLSMRGVVAGGLVSDAHGPSGSGPCRD